MELDDFKQRAFSSDKRDDIPDLPDINLLKDKIQSNLKKQRRNLIIFAGVDMAIALIYLSRLNSGSILFKLGIALIALGLLLSAAYLWFSAKLLKDSVFSLPLTEFLSTSEKRLRFMRLKDWLIILPLLLLLGTGGGLVFTTRLLLYTENLVVLVIIWCIFFPGLCIFGFIVSRKDWVKAHGPLLEEIKKLQSGLQNGNGSAL